MTVAELIEELEKYPQDTKVNIYTANSSWDSACSYQELTKDKVTFDKNDEELDLG